MGDTTNNAVAPIAAGPVVASPVDTRSPYYVHPSDHPGLHFVTQPLTENGDNFFAGAVAFSPLSSPKTSLDLSMARFRCLLQTMLISKLGFNAMH